MSEETPDPEVVALASKIFDLARSGDAASLAAYVDAGAPADLANEQGDTLVMLAAYHGHAEAVTALLARGADPNRPNDRGQTPVAGAVFKGEDAVVRALLAGGADPEAGTPSAVDTARMFGKTDLLELFAAR
ncbi:ankyrin repeat domain-containing protein [Streptomyces sp. CC228A]|uniref:ankyrin repeat domain-containing protein n=1 Tax=Streptomyces sp. CC228A TaxID=2898186 RepID=UPI001F24C9B9|nr:ankyrin repeat domain-containing protein [Streptomyces sp. CC228A]